MLSHHFGYVCFKIVIYHCIRPPILNAKTDLYSMRNAKYTETYQNDMDENRLPYLRLKYVSVQQSILSAHRIHYGKMKKTNHQKSPKYILIDTELQLSKAHCMIFVHSMQNCQCHVRFNDNNNKRRGRINHPPHCILKFIRFDFRFLLLLLWTT